MKVIPFSPAPDLDVVQLLSDLLRRAESGELRAVAVAGLLNDGGLATVFCGSSPLPLLGAVALLKAEMLEETLHCAHD